MTKQSPVARGGAVLPLAHSYAQTVSSAELDQGCLDVSPPTAAPQTSCAAWAVLQVRPSCVLCWQIEEGRNGKLQGNARVGDQQLPPPEIDPGKGAVAARVLTWRLLHGGQCYILQLAVMKRFSVTQVTLNGFVVAQKQHSIWDQVLPPAAAALTLACMHCCPVQSCLHSALLLEQVCALAKAQWVEQAPSPCSG